MNYFSKYRYAIWTIIVLAVIIVTAIIASVILNYSHKTSMGKQGHFHDMRKMLHVELKLSPDQDAKIEIIQKDFKIAIHPIIKEIKEKREAMTKELSVSNPDTSVLYRLSADIGNLHNQLKHEALKHLLQIRAICDTSQIEKLNIITMKLLETENLPGGEKKDKR